MGRTRDLADSLRLGIDAKSKALESSEPPKGHNGTLSLGVWS